MTIITILLHVYAHGSMATITNHCGNWRPFPCVRNEGYLTTITYHYILQLLCKFDDPCPQVRSQVFSIACRNFEKLGIGLWASAIRIISVVSNISSVHVLLCFTSSQEFRVHLWVLSVSWLARTLVITSHWPPSSSNWWPTRPTTGCSSRS